MTGELILSIVVMVIAVIIAAAFAFAAYCVLTENTPGK